LGKVLFESVSIWGTVAGVEDGGGSGGATVKGDVAACWCGNEVGTSKAVWDLLC
jgi:hypothetical protein